MCIRDSANAAGKSPEQLEAQRPPQCMQPRGNRAGAVPPRIRGPASQTSASPSLRPCKTAAGSKERAGPKRRPGPEGP
eukprot:11185929-Alexandrium_andersonii.AAC.1